MVERMKGLAMLLEIISFFHLHCSWEEPSCEGGLCQGSTMMVRQTIILFRICILGEKHFVFDSVVMISDIVKFVLINGFASGSIE